MRGVNFFGIFTFRKISAFSGKCGNGIEEEEVFTTMEKRVMKETVKSLEEMVKDLPIEDRDEVKDFIAFLLHKRQNGKKRKTPRKPTYAWAGVLADLGKKYTSVELQHEISGWRID